MNKKYLAALMLIVVAGSFGMAGAMFSVPASTSEQTYDGVKYTTAVTKTVYKLNSAGEYEITEQDTTHNLLTNSGRLMIKNLIYGLTAQNANISVLAISNSTAPAAGDTALAGSALMDNCGLGNVTAVKNHVNATAIDISWQWTNTCTNQVVNTTGIFNSTAAGIVNANSVEFAGATLTSSTLQNTDKIQVNYTINIG